jgi:very-short-patch-repair endonuclease
MKDAAISRTLVDCVTALDGHPDLWSGIPVAGLHLRARPGRHIGTVPEGAVVHWAEEHDRGSSGPEVGPVDALLSAVRCLDPYDVIACIESALHLGYLDERGFRKLQLLAPQWMHPYFSRIDRGAQSGLETHPRLWLQDLGHRVETQVPIPGAGILDLLVDGLVGIETDGAKWHQHKFLADRSKDIGVERWGVRVLRIGRPHIFETWAETLATIDRMLDGRPPSATAQLRNNAPRFKASHWRGAEDLC